MIFSFFSASEIQRHITGAFREKHFSSYHTMKESLHAKKQKALLQQFKSSIHEKDSDDLIVEKTSKKPKKEKKSAKKRCYKLNFDLSRPPDNARFNLRHFLIDPHKKLGERTRIEIFESILITLYRDAPFFQKIPCFEQRITEALFKEKDKLLEASFADEIGILNFEDEQLRDAFYKMLSGTGEFPSLLNFFALDEQTKPTINLLFAAPEIIRAALNNDSVAQQVISCRNEFFAHMSLPDTQLTRTQIRLEMRKQIESIFGQHGLSKEYGLLFDYTVGKPGRLIFFHDNMTGKLHHEKIFFPKIDIETSHNSEL